MENKELLTISGIYTITNLVNNKMYVGQAVNIAKRKYSHINRLRKNTHKNKELQKDWNKYGEEYIQLEVLEECEIQYLKSQEHYWVITLESYNAEKGYNKKRTSPEEIKYDNKLARDKEKRRQQELSNILNKLYGTKY